MAIDVKEQIRQRMMSDEDLFSDAFINLSEVVTGSKFFDMFSEKQLNQATNALDAILRYYAIKDRKTPPEGLTSFEDRVNWVITPLGIMRRYVTLEKGWYKDAFGAYMGVLKDGSVVALIPGVSGYYYVDNTTGEKVRINSKNADTIEPQALCFYMPMPQEKMTKKQLLLFIFKNLHVSDYVRIALLTLIVTLVSMVTPYITQYLYSHVVFQESLVPLIAAFVLLITSNLASRGIGLLKTLALTQVKSRTDKFVLSAMMMRVFTLPVNFFRKYSSGNLVSRIFNASSIASTVLDTVLSSGISVIISLFYLAPISGYSGSLVLPAFLILLFQVAFSILSIFVKVRVMTNRNKAAAEEQGYLQSAFNGVQKIRLNGSERRVFANWAELYKKTAMYTYMPGWLDKYSGVISAAISLIGSLLIYYVGYRNGLDPVSYMTFNSSYGLLAGSFSSLAGVAAGFAGVSASLKMIEPILQEEPEVYASRNIATSLKGEISMQNVSFRYSQNMPMVIDNLTLNIRPGEYLAIVGKSGCGKSTVTRLLMGFEKPDKGSIFYDGKEISQYDPRSLRKRMGIVMQTSQLFPGSIKDNISVTAPYCTEDDIWEALKMAGIYDDIKAMPMGLNTMLSESGGGISGGQRQRLIIARAIISKPDILFFDEATSALDNIAQKVVADSLSSLNCTRIVIAHRLSTVRNCDRIIMLDGGNIAEEGTYDELMALDGKFAKLVKRQQI